MRDHARKSTRYSKFCRCERCNGRTPSQKPHGNVRARVQCDHCGPMDGFSRLPCDGGWRNVCCCCGRSLNAPGSLFRARPADPPADTRRTEKL